MVIDTNVLPKMFNRKNTDYCKYNKFREWIYGPKGHIKYGGSKYLMELKRLVKIVRLINEFGRSGKAKCLPRTEVDAEQIRIEGLCNQKRFNDAHILAIAIVGRCKCICSEDKSAHQFFKDRDNLYPNAGLPRFNVIHSSTTGLDVSHLYE